MKKFIKVNFIILVMLCLSCSHVLAEFNNEQEILVEDNLQEEIIDDNENVEEEKDLDTLRIEKSELENEIEESNSQIQFIQEELSLVVLEVAELTQKIYDKQLEIDTLMAQEKELLEYIERAEKELEKSNKRYEKQKKLLEKRLISMYEKGETTYLDVLLNSKGITEFVSNWYIIAEIAESDKKLLETVEAEKVYNRKIKENLDMKKGILSASRETIEKETIAISNMTKIKDKKLRDLTAEELALQQMVQEYQDQVQAIETEIRLLAIANVSEEYVGGVMSWPVPGYTRITSQFGMRTHPITGIYKLHTGTDIGAPMGADFIAANDGIVIYSGESIAYGRMVIVDHGGGVSTLYAHGSELLVEVGDIVFQGTPILKVGSTGYSTGAHAHFEVRINGEYVDPLNYITSYGDVVEHKLEENGNSIIIEFEDNKTKNEEIEETLQEEKESGGENEN